MPQEFTDLVVKYSEKTDATINTIGRDMIRSYILTEGSLATSESDIGFYYREGIEYIQLDVFDDNLEVITQFHTSADELRKLKGGNFLDMNKDLYNTFLQMSENRGLQPMGSFAQAMRLYSAIMELKLKDENVYVKIDGEFDIMDLDHQRRINLDDPSTWGS